MATADIIKTTTDRQKAWSSPSLEAANRVARRCGPTALVGIIGRNEEFQFMYAVILKQEMGLGAIYAAK